MPCPVCGLVLGAGESGRSSDGIFDYDERDGTGGGGGLDDDEAVDPMLRVASSQGRAEGLLRALWMTCSPDDAEIAEYVVGSLDSILRPILIRKGAHLPLILLLAGVIGGLIAFGLVGIFLGPVVLAVGYTLLQSWMDEDFASAEELSQQRRRAGSTARRETI